MKRLRVVLIKPSKYAVDGSVERFRKGFLPNATLFHIAGLTPTHIEGVPVEVRQVDEYVWQDLGYLQWLQHDPDIVTLIALVGVQSHQFHRALDLTAYARHHGIRHCVIGGPHPMTCDTSMFQGRGVSFAIAEGELVWLQILKDALKGELRSLYGPEQRWAYELPPTVITPPGATDLARYAIPMLGLYPVRGCPYKCNFCSVIKISGRQVRNPSIESTMESLRRAKRGGVEMIFFVSDNFNKFPSVRSLLEAMIGEHLRIPFFCQCDTRIGKEPELMELLGRAGCCEIFVGVESFNRKTLKAAGKHHNHPEQYADIIRLCKQAGIRPHFSNIIGFPEDDEIEIKHHLDVLKQLHPTVASFFVLTPIPGTEQYAELRKKGLITEKNLDRFDTTYPCWTHPNLSAQRLDDLLYYCYVHYSGFLLKSGGLSLQEHRQAVFHRLQAAQRMHPMSGGFDRLHVDSAADYSALRRAVFDIDLVPLPDNLALSPKDEALNRRVKMVPTTAVEQRTMQASSYTAN